MKNISKIKVGAFFVVFVVGLYVFLDYLPSKRLEKNRRYTVAIITEITHPFEGGPSARIKYSVNNKTYYSFFDFDRKDPKFVVGSKFFVAFDSNNPNNCIVKENIVVSDTVNVIPINGWDKSLIEN